MTILIQSGSSEESAGVTQEKEVTKGVSRMIILFLKVL